MSRKKNLKELKVKIGDIGICVQSLSVEKNFRIDEALKNFTAEGKSEVSLKFHIGDIPAIESCEIVFDCIIWKLCRNNGKNILGLFSHDYGSLPYTVAVFTSDFLLGDIYKINKVSSHNILPDPLEYPLGEVLMINLLSLGRGILVHACAVEVNGKGVLFAGKSGEGKSTLANLWSKEKDAIVLNDDRIIIRETEDDIFLYGTPWHGDMKICSPKSVPLKNIFFLKHASHNYLKKLNSMESTSKLLLRMFPPLWSCPGMEYTLAFSARLTQKIPCFELGLVKDQAAIDFIRSHV